MSSAETSLMIARAVAQGQEAGTVTFKRASRATQADNSTSASAWSTVSGVVPIPALIQVEDTASEGGAGDLNSARAGGVVIGPGVVPQVGDGIVVDTGEHAGLHFLVTAIVRLAGHGYECAVQETALTF